MTSKADVYSADSIEVLSGLEAVRRRPGMYIGDVRDGFAIHYILWEVVSNALDEHLAGGARRIRVSIEGQLAEVEDDGRGMPLDRQPPLGVSFVELALTSLHMGRPTLDGHLPHVHVGPTGLGLAVVNAVSESLEIEVRRDGWSWHQRFARGIPLGRLDRGARTERTGTRVRFLADRSIFGQTVLDRSTVRRRLRELAAFNPTLTFDLMAEQVSEPRGVLALVDANAREEVTDTFTTCTTRDDVLVEVALGWAHDDCIRVQSFVGQSETVEGGTHERGFWKGLLDAIAEPTLGRVSPRAWRERWRFGGLNAIVHVDLRHPRFGGPTRSRLANPEVGTIVRQVVRETYGEYLREHPTIARALVDRLRANGSGTRP